MGDDIDDGVAEDEKVEGLGHRAVRSRMRDGRACRTLLDKRQARAGSGRREQGGDGQREAGRIEEEVAGRDQAGLDQLAVTATVVDDRAPLGVEDEVVPQAR
ncbi:hypothetical protein GCM10025880_24670 [Methylorubrum aminovorans]|nr:hypothetical protein GCM10025880_24670 [Methylorubrum aminovorans]